jgi:plastocyanin
MYSRIPASALLLFLFSATCLRAATVSGEIRLIESHNSAVKKKSDYSGVAVWLTSPGIVHSVAVSKHAQMLQKDKKFVPHIIVIQTGTIVDFPNLDPIFHNAFSNFDGKVFDVALYPPGSSRSVRFDRPGIVRVFCNIHPQMSAIIVVVNSPYFAISDEAGDYRINNVASGSYRVNFFHERATPETLDKLATNVVVNSEPLALAEMKISEAGYLPVAHKNKYGQDYPPNAGEATDYSLPLK